MPQLFRQAVLDLLLQLADTEGQDHHALVLTILHLRPIAMLNRAKVAAIKEDDECESLKAQSRVSENSFVGQPAGCRGEHDRRAGFLQVPRVLSAQVVTLAFRRLFTLGAIACGHMPQFDPLPLRQGLSVFRYAADQISHRQGDNNWRAGAIGTPSNCCRIVD